MRFHRTNNILSPQEKDLLEKFITSFLPMRGNKRKNSGNELDYVSNTLDKLFRKEFGINLSRENVRDSFVKLGYDIFTKNGVWDSEKKDFKPSNDGDAVRAGDGYEDFDASFIYFDIDPPIVRNLMLTRQTIPNLNAERQAEIDVLRKRIQSFKQLYWTQGTTN